MASFFLKECGRVLANDVVVIVSVIGSIQSSVVSVDMMFILEILRPMNSSYNFG